MLPAAALPAVLERARLSVCPSFPVRTVLGVGRGERLQGRAVLSGAQDPAARSLLLSDLTQLLPF